MDRKYAVGFHLKPALHCKTAYLQTLYICKPFTSRHYKYSSHYTNLKTTPLEAVCNAGDNTEFTDFNTECCPKIDSVVGRKPATAPLFFLCMGYSSAIPILGQKFARNRCICYGYRDIHNFSFSAKVQYGRQKWPKLKFFPTHRILLNYPVGPKFARNPSTSYSFHDIHTFSCSTKIQAVCQK